MKNVSDNAEFSDEMDYVGIFRPLPPMSPPQFNEPLALPDIPSPPVGELFTPSPNSLAIVPTFNSSSPPSSSSQLALDMNNAQDKFAESGRRYKVTRISICHFIFPKVVALFDPWS